MLHAYGGSLVLFGCMYGQIHLAVMLNEWSKRFFDIFGNPLEHTMDDIYNRIVELTLIIVLRVGVDVAATSFTRLYTFQWREALTFYYLPLWCNTDIHVEGASQRIQEDISRAAKVVESMGWTVVSTLMTLVAFIPILWSF